MKIKWNELSIRERDALVAEKVTKRPLPKQKVSELELRCNYYPEYSTSISAAWEVVEKLQSKYWHFQLYRYQANEYGYNGWTASIATSDEEWTDNADTAPEAICLAALKAVGVDVE